MENSKQPVKEVSPFPRHPTIPPVTSSLANPVKHAASSIQHIQVASSVVSSFNHLKPPERDTTLFSQMKSIKSLRHAGFTAVFSGQARVESGVAEVPILDAVQADVDSLVPTHNEAGQPIAEWRRQVMIRQLQVRLQDEEELRRQDTVTNGYIAVDGWKYSRAHKAILGPFGELLSEDDLVLLRGQVDALSLQKRQQQFELELASLTEELRAIIPDPVVITPFTEDGARQADVEGRLPLPLWCCRVLEIVRAMSLLLSNLGGSGDEGGSNSHVDGKIDGGKELQGVRGGLSLALGQCQSPAHQAETSGYRIPHIGMASAFSHRLDTTSSGRERRERVEREIQQSGVSVRNLRSNFEGHMGGAYPFAGVVTNSNRLVVEKPNVSQKGLGDGTSEVPSLTANTACERTCCSALKPAGAVRETVSLRKERIVVLFLSHWKKSAYAITMRAARLRQDQEVGGGGDVVATSPQQQRPITSMFHFCRQRNAVGKMLIRWRQLSPGLGDEADPSTSRSPSLSTPQGATYSPEHFLPDVDGVNADSLTLDLFMLEYFHILEQELSPAERKMRHLLCFEVFDHVGCFPWETVRDFHKAVLQEIQSGRRQWSEGFEDIKVHFFGDSRECHCASSTSSTLVADDRRVPAVVVQAAAADRRGNDTDLSCFYNEEICKYINRSFAFWKEKEAEMFDFDR